MRKIEKPKHGEKTIKLSIHFFTEGLDGRRQAWSKGRIAPVSNGYHRLRNNDESCEMFNSWEELPSKIATVLKKNGISIFREMKKSEGGHIVLVRLE